MTTTPLKLLATAVMAVAMTILAGAGGGSGPGAAAPVPKVSEPENPLITPDTRKAIDAGLEYLAKNQTEEGAWVTGDYRGTVACTAFAGRAFLAAGYQPGQGPNGARLTKAIEYVLKSEDGGLLARGKAPMYEHGFAVHFLAEAYGKVTDKTLKERMKATLTRALKVIADGQNREGGWRYQPKSRDADISVTCCQLHALAAAKRAGFDVPQATVDNGINYVLSCRDLNHGARFCYVPRIPSTAPAAFEYTAAAISALKAVGYKAEGSSWVMARSSFASSSRRVPRTPFSTTRATTRPRS